MTTLSCLHDFFLELYFYRVRLIDCDANQVISHYSSCLFVVFLRGIYLDIPPLSLFDSEKKEKLLHFSLKTLKEHLKN